MQLSGRKVTAATATLLIGIGLSAAIAVTHRSDRISDPGPVRRSAPVVVHVELGTSDAIITTGCASATVFPVGETRTPIELTTRSATCETSVYALAHGPGPRSPRCVPPPLPGGDYETRIVGAGDFPRPAPLTVHVLSPGAALQTRVEVPGSVPAGESVHGTLVVINRSAAPIPHGHCTDPYQLYLTNGTDSTFQHVVIDCTDPELLPSWPVGETRVPVTISTQHACPVGEDCAYRPLPPGIYHVKLDPGRSNVSELPPTEIQVVGIK
jgi:hypothetical protein